MATDPLSPAEALVLLDPRKGQSRAALKLTLTGLLMQGVLRLEESEEKGLFGRTKKVTRLRVSPDAPAVPPPAASVVEVVRAAEAKGGKLDELALQARKAYGTDLSGFQKSHVVPALVARGLVEERRERMLGLIPVRRLYHTAAGEAEKSRLETLIAEARNIPDYLSRDLGRAAAVAAALGGALLLVDELRPFYGRISEALRGADPNAFGDYDFWSRDVPSLSSGSFDLASFDPAALDGLDTSLAALDTSFDASFDSGSSDGGGDSGGGGSGGD